MQELIPPHKRTVELTFEIFIFWFVQRFLLHPLEKGDILMANNSALAEQAKGECRMTVRCEGNMS